MPHHPPVSPVPALSHWADQLHDAVVGNHVAAAAEVVLKLLGRLGGAGADDERQARVLQRIEVGRRQHSRIGHHDHVADLVALLKGRDDRD